MALKAGQSKSMTYIEHLVRALLLLTIQRGITWWNRPAHVSSSFLIIYLFYVYEYSVAAFRHTREGIRSHHRWLWATMSLLGIELRTSGRAVSACNLWAISPASLETTKSASTCVSTNLSSLASEKSILVKTKFTQECSFLWTPLLHHFSHFFVHSLSQIINVYLIVTQSLSYLQDIITLLLWNFLMFILSLFSRFFMSQSQTVCWLHFFIFTGSHAAQAASNSTCSWGWSWTPDLMSPPPEWHN